MISEITLMDVLNSRMGNDRKERLMDLSKIKIPTLKNSEKRLKKKSFREMWDKDTMSKICVTGVREGEKT